MFVSEPVLRVTLWVACPFNLLAAYLVALPGSRLGQLYGLPSEVPALYAGLAAMFIALFGLAYLWLAISETVNRSILFLGAVGKLSAFLLAAGLWLAGAAPLPIAIASSGDLAFALLWLSWLRRPPTAG